jgi:hypothetical protein
MTGLILPDSSNGHTFSNNCSAICFLKVLLLARNVEPVMINHLSKIGRRLISALDPFWRAICTSRESKAMHFKLRGK